MGGRELGDFLFSPQVFAVAVAAAWQISVEARDNTTSSFSAVPRLFIGIGAFVWGKVWPHITSYHTQTIWGASLSGYRYDIPGIATLAILSRNSLSPKELVTFALKLGWIHITTAYLIGFFLGTRAVGDSPYEAHYKDLAFAGSLMSLVGVLAFTSWIGATVKRLRKPLAFALSCLFTASLGIVGLYLFRQLPFIAALWITFCIIGFPLILGWLVSSRTHQLTNAQLIDMYKTGVNTLPTVFRAIGDFLGEHPKSVAASTSGSKRRKVKGGSRRGISAPKSTSKHTPKTAELPSEDLGEN